VIFIVDLNHDLNRFKSMIQITWFKSHQRCFIVPQNFIPSQTNFSRCHWTLIVIVLNMQ